jgi:hypothetical protein
MDVVLVMDSSGSMKKTDPDSLRIPAAKLFISLLGKNDRAGVMSFSESATLLKGLTAADNDEHRAELLHATENITSDGLYTNLYDAMDKGRELLISTGRSDSQKILVLMSDGMMDVGDAARDKELISDMSGNLTKRLKDEGIKVYTIAFTNQSDRRLLEKVSKRTDGFYNLALADSDLHVIFTSIFESLKAPEMLPMAKNGFLIDKSVEEVTIVATKATPETIIQLDAPDGQGYTYKSRNSGIKWFLSNKFDMITVKLPVEGRWEILFSTGENNKAYVITDLKLRTSFDHMYTIFGRPMDISFWLEKENEPIKEKNVLDKIDVFIELTGPDGKLEKLEPFDKGDGVFMRKIAPFTAGNYKMKIAAEGKTFEREKTFIFNVAGLKDAKEDVQEERQEKTEEADTMPVQAIEEPEDKVSWGKVIGQFLGINIVLFAFAYMYYKRKELGWLMKIRNIVDPGKIKGLIMFWKKDKEEEVQPEKSGSAEEVKAEAATEEETAAAGSSVEEPEAEAEAAPQEAALAQEVKEEVTDEEIPAETAEESGSVEELKSEATEKEETAVDEEKQETVSETAVEEAGSAEEVKEEVAEEKPAGEVVGQDDLDKLLEEAGSAEEVKTEAAGEETESAEEEKEEEAEEKPAGEVVGQDDLDKLFEEAGSAEEISVETESAEDKQAEETKTEVQETEGGLVDQDDLDKLFEEAGAAPVATGDVEKPKTDEIPKAKEGSSEAVSDGLVTQADLDKLLEEGK